MGIATDSLDLAYSTVSLLSVHGAGAPTSHVGQPLRVAIGRRATRPVILDARAQRRDCGDEEALGNGNSGRYVRSFHLED